MAAVYLYTECSVCFIVMLNNIVLNAIMLNVGAPNEGPSVIELYTAVIFVIS
jgi:hypothetical protein